MSSTSVFNKNEFFLVYYVIRRTNFKIYASSFCLEFILFWLDFTLIHG